MKRHISFLCSLALLLGLLTGCGGTKTPDDGDKLKIVATVFPAYDWTRAILGDRADAVELTLLLDNGVDLHSYQPTADDMVTLSDCDMFIHVGGESDEWVDDALAEAVNQKMVVLNMMDLLGGALKEETTPEGAQEEAEEAEGEIEYDEHVWLSLRNAAVLCGAISTQLGRLDPENASAYAENSAAYIAELKALDARYTAAVEGATVKTLLFGDRFPFRYLADDYGLAYYAAFSGCSAETEASFETVVFLAETIDALGLPAVLTIETGDSRLAQTIVDNTAAKSAQILRLDSLQSTTAQEIADGATYLGTMENNLTVLTQALL